MLLSYCYLIKKIKQCLKCSKNTECKNPKVVNTKNGRVMLLSKCEVCNNKKAKFVKEQQARQLLSSLGINTPLNKIPLFLVNGSQALYVNPSCLKYISVINLSPVNKNLLTISFILYP